MPAVAVNTSGSGGRFSVEQTVYILYIALAAADLLLVVFSIIMLFGVEKVICMYKFSHVLPFSIQN